MLDHVAPPSVAVTRVLVVDDHRTLAEAISMAITSQPDLECVGTAHGVDDALAFAARLDPDVVVMDLRMADGDGLQATRRLLADAPHVRVVLLTAYVDRGLLQRAIWCGASALMPKNGALDDLLHAVRTAHPSRFIVPPDIVTESMRTPEPLTGTRSPLTQRESEVLGQLAAGSDASTVARALGISLLTSRGHIKSILGKLDAHTQLEAVMTAIRLRLIKVDD
jgi:DNA-binding NarL/FixJ family response regulator